MRRPLFVKIFLGVWLSFLFVTYFVWFEDSLLKTSPSRTTAVQAQIALAGASSIVRLGGEAALKRELATWPKERQYMTYQRIDGGRAPAPDPMPLQGLYTATAKDSQGNSYALLYHVTRFDGYVSPPLPLDMGPNAIFGTLIGILLFSGLLTFYLTAPINRIRAGFGRLASGDLKVRLGANWLRRRAERQSKYCQNSCRHRSRVELPADRCAYLRFSGNDPRELWRVLYPEFPECDAARASLHRALR